MTVEAEVLGKQNRGLPYIPLDKVKKNFYI
jgi:hypothetical protein